MKLKISPSHAEPHYHSVEIDTLANDETTSEAVEIAMTALIAYLHHPCVVIESARQWADEQEQSLAHSKSKDAND
jgi:hypothetical protein